MQFASQRVGLCIRINQAVEMSRSDLLKKNYDMKGDGHGQPGHLR